MTITSTLHDRLSRVRDLVNDAAARSGRSLDSITIVGVSKTVGRPEIDQAYELGLRHFGENRIPDAKAKVATPLPGDAVLHMIGQLQSNKAGQAADIFDIIESVDRRSLIEELERQGAKRGKPIPVLAEISVAGEEQKAGCSIDQAPALVDLIDTMPHLELRGLMTMAPLVADEEATRPVFRGLRELRDRLVEGRPERELPILSMGMSNDFAIAIEEGATHVRIGRAIFGG
jgi:pyridoxal phosphate enzyme (YggS family)